MVMQNLFADPWDYVEGVEPTFSGPVGLTGGDERRWTHEVRIRDRLIVRENLEAVFLPKARFRDPIIEPLLTWCKEHNVPIESFEVPRDGQFEKLQKACLGYLHRRYR